MHDSSLWSDAIAPELVLFVNIVSPTAHTAHCTVHCEVYSILFLSVAHCTQCTKSTGTGSIRQYCFSHCSHCAVCTVEYTLCTLYKVYSILFLSNTHCTLYTVYKVYQVYQVYTLYKVYQVYTLCIHCMLCSLQSTVHFQSSAVFLHPCSTLSRPVLNSAGFSQYCHNSGHPLYVRWAPVGVMIQLWYLELHDSPLELKGELQYLDENCHFRGEKMTILV